MAKEIGYQTQSCQRGRDCSQEVPPSIKKNFAEGGVHLPSMSRRQFVKAVVHFVNKAFKADLVNLDQEAGVMKVVPKVLG